MCHHWFLERGDNIHNRKCSAVRFCEARNVIVDELIGEVATSCVDVDAVERFFFDHKTQTISKTKLEQSFVTFYVAYLTVRSLVSND